MKVTHYLLMITMMLFLCSWGEKGHQKINSSAPQFFPSALNNFKGWSEVLAVRVIIQQKWKDRSGQ